MTAQLTAPVKVCPHCSAQAQTVDTKCPHCGKKYKKKSVALKILLGLAVLMVVVIGGCTALLGAGLNEAVERLNEEGVLDAADINQSCIYCNREGGQFGDIFQFCFDGDVLTTKNSY